MGHTKSSHLGSQPSAAGRYGAIESICDIFARFYGGLDLGDDSVYF